MYIIIFYNKNNLIFRSKLAQLKAEQLGRTGNKSSEEEEAGPGPSRVEVEKSRYPSGYPASWTSMAGYSLRCPVGPRLGIFMDIGLTLDLQSNQSQN